jgi:hypothetical protein
MNAIGDIGVHDDFRFFKLIEKDLQQHLLPLQKRKAQMIELFAEAEMTTDLLMEAARYIPWFSYISRFPCRDIDLRSDVRPK